MTENSDSHSSDDAQIVKKEDNENLETEESTSSPYMLLPESDTSEMRLMIEGSDDTKKITQENADDNYVVKPNGQSQCCLLL